MSWLESIQFASPWVLVLLVALPVWWIVRRRRRPPAIVFSRVSVLASGPRAGRATTLFLFLFRNLLLASTIVALSRPRTGAHAEDVTSEGINIVLAIDLSSSMLAQDFQPQNRLEVAKDVVKRFINARTSDRIGVVAFAAEALTQVPLTTDYPVVNAAVDNLAAGQLEDGTAIGTAIATAANRLRDAPGRSRVMIVLTDGENNRGAIDPRTAAKAAGVFGIKIYTIGVGTRCFVAGAPGYVAWEGTQHNPNQARDEHGVPTAPAGTLAVIADLKAASPEFFSAATFTGYGVSSFVGIGIPIPVLDEEIAETLALTDADIQATIVDYGVPRRSRPSFGKVTYAQLRTGDVTIEGKRVPTGPISSLPKARRIAALLKEWVGERRWTLNPPLQQLPQTGSQGVKPLEIRNEEAV